MLLTYVAAISQLMKSWPTHWILCCCMVMLCNRYCFNPYIYIYNMSVFLVFIFHGIRNKICVFQVLSFLLLLLALMWMLPKLHFSKNLVIWLFFLAFLLSVATTWYRLYKVGCPCFVCCVCYFLSMPQLKPCGSSYICTI